MGTTAPGELETVTCPTKATLAPSFSLSSGLPFRKFSWGAEIRIKSPSSQAKSRTGAGLTANAEAAAKTARNPMLERCFFNKWLSVVHACDKHGRDAAIH